MAHFTTTGRRYREGTSFVSFGGTDVGVTSPGETFDQTAPSALLDNGIVRRFLYWDTGRRVTSKRHVRWTFNHPDAWSTWNATAWYGIPPEDGDGGPPIVSFDAYWVGSGSLDPTPIDGAGSTFINGPTPADQAWPAGGNDHKVNTQWGAATVRALAHLRRSAGDPDLDFSSLTQLVYGGDDTDVCEENDDGVTSSSGIFGLTSTTAQELTFAQGSSAVVLAGYVQPVAQIPDFMLRVFERIEEVVPEKLIIPKGDPPPIDVLRLRLIADSLQLVRGERPSADVFSGLVSAARGMSKAELKRTIASTRATLRRGEAALKSMETISKKAQQVK
jgi:hypothetical protein